MKNNKLKEPLKNEDCPSMQDTHRGSLKEKLTAKNEIAVTPKNHRHMGFCEFNRLIDSPIEPRESKFAQAAQRESPLL